ncbi:MAG: nucleotidyltransferase family protein [Prevotella sp.]|nr:nucleotidyltransferase family protein [Prevotella sp.]
MKQAMIFAAGLGTRLKPLTDTMPKALVPVDGEPLLWHVLNRLKRAGFDRVVINVHHLAQQIVDYLQANGNFGLDIRISDETSLLLETGGGIKRARPLFDEHAPILIHNVDILSNLPLAELYRMGVGNRTDALLVASRRTTKRYLLFDRDLQLQGWTNIETREMKGPAAELHLPASRFKQLAFAGIHVFSPRLFPLMDQWPDRFSIVDFYLQACADHVIRAYEAPHLQLLDVGKQDTLAKADEFVKLLYR